MSADTVHCTLACSSTGVTRMTDAAEDIVVDLPHPGWGWRRAQDARPPPRSLLGLPRQPRPSADDRDADGWTPELGWCAVDWPERLQAACAASAADLSEGTLASAGLERVLPPVGVRSVVRTDGLRVPCGCLLVPCGCSGAPSDPRLTITFDS